MQKKSVKKGTWLGIVGFVLSIVVLLLAVRFAEQGCARHDPLGEVKLVLWTIAILISPILCTIGLIKAKGKSKIIVFVGLAIGLVIVLFLTYFSLMWVWIGFILHADPCGNSSPVMCVETKLDITNINLEQNAVTVTRLPGGDDDYVTGMRCYKASWRR